MELLSTPIVVTPSSRAGWPISFACVEETFGGVVSMSLEHGLKATIE